MRYLHCAPDSFLPERFRWHTPTSLLAFRGVGSYPGAMSRITGKQPLIAKKCESPLGVVSMKRVLWYEIDITVYPVRLVAAIFRAPRVW